MDNVNVEVEEETPATEETPEVQEEENEEAQEVTETVEAEKTKLEKRPNETDEDLLRRINSLTAKGYEKDKRVKALEDENKSLKRKSEAGPRPSPPDPENYKNDLGETDSARFRSAQMKHEDDLHGWRQAQAQAPAPAAEQEATGDGGFEAVRNTFIERSEAMQAKHPDFKEVCARQVFPLDTLEQVTAAIFESEAGPEIAYHLGNNAAEAERIGGLNEKELYREIGKLEARFSASPERRTKSSAPEPLKPVGGDAQVAKDPEKMTDEEWSKWDDAQQLKKLKAG